MEKPSGESKTYWDSIASNPVISRASDVLIALQKKREALGLSNPGQIDNISKEVERDVFLNGHIVDGLRAEVSKTLCYGKPLFQVSHQFAMGSQTQPPYALSAMYGSSRMFLQYLINSDKQINTRFNWRWSKAFVSKAAASLSPDDTRQAHMVTLENDYTGKDFSASVKFMNPSLFEGGYTGMFSADYLQAVTPRLSLGLSALYQRVSMSQGPETMISYGARYKGDDWIGSARLLPLGGVQLSYWRALSPKIETGADLQVSVAQPNPAEMMFGGMGSSGPKFEGTATLGAKYEFRASIFRAQIDSNGKLGCFLDKRIAPAVGIQFFGQIDHVKNEAKLGLGVQLESMSEEVQEQAQTMSSADMPSIPF